MKLINLSLSLKQATIMTGYSTSILCKTFD